MTEAAKIMSDIPAYVRAFGVAAREAARILATVPTRQKNDALLAMAEGTADNETQILAANRLDMEAGESSGLSVALLDRLELTPDRIAAMAEGLRQVAALPCLLYTSDAADE